MRVSRPFSLGGSEELQRVVGATAGPALPKNAFTIHILLQRRSPTPARASERAYCVDRSIPAAGKEPEKPGDDGDDQKHDSNPQQPLKCLDEATDKQQDDGDNGDNDEK